MENFQIRELGKRDWPKVLEIVRNLNGWFDAVALSFEIPNDLKFHKGLAAEVNGEVVGFLTYSSFEGEVFISWLGVNPDCQRQGIGKSLVLKLENILDEYGFDSLKVETLSAKIEYEPYERTRAFYKKIGFSEAETRSFISKADQEELEMVTFRKKFK
ncbi:MAG: GNAT family N-acetyltransferase [Candidatus Berkelbacteria bacterium]|nr:GNAT family N-acetyltransferase [Candidatus Berkelbacteria bacterium]